MFKLIMSAGFVYIMGAIAIFVLIGLYVINATEKKKSKAVAQDKRQKPNLFKDGTSQDVALPHTSRPKLRFSSEVVERLLSNGSD